MFALLVAANTAQAQAGPVVPCDVDEDGDVDLDDFLAFVSCQTGPLDTHDSTQICAFADSNSDGHVDVLDFRNLQACFSGSGNVGDSNCAVRPIAVALNLPCANGSLPDPSQPSGLDLHKVTNFRLDTVVDRLANLAGGGRQANVAVGPHAAEILAIALAARLARRRRSLLDGPTGTKAVALDRLGLQTLTMSVSSKSSRSPSSTES